MAALPKGHKGGGRGSNQHVRKGRPVERPAAPRAAASSTLRAAADVAASDDWSSLEGRWGDPSTWQEVPAVHATSAANADAIRSSGFRSGAGESGNAGRQAPLWGTGVYVSLDAPTAALWRTPDAVEMPVTVSLARPLFYDYGNAKQKRRDEVSICRAAVEQHLPRPLPPSVQAHYDRLFPGGVSPYGGNPCPVEEWGWRAASDRYRELVFDCRREHGTQPGRDDTLAESKACVALLREFGYDGLVVREDEPSHHAGGTQAVVFDPAAVTPA